MKITKNFIKVSDRHEVYYEVYEPENPLAHVHILHGMAEHIGRYEEFVNFLTSNGFAVSGHDHRGHGKTAERNGVQGFFAERDGFARVVEDAKEVITAVQSQIKELPLILFGHSMGSFLARRYIQLYSGSVSRTVLSGTGGDPGAAGKAGLSYALLASKMQGPKVPSLTLGAMTFGRYMKAFKNEESSFAWLSSDASEVAKYEADPMCGFVSTNRFYVDLLTGIALIHKNSEVEKIRKDLPVLLISGAKDPVGDNGKGVFSSAKQYAASGMGDVTVYLAEKGRHELLHEINKRLYFEAILNWLLRDD